MAHISDDNGSSGNRTVSVDVNLVPFIDLMSVLIIFLLITAVWTQVSMIQLGSSIYGKKQTEDSAPPPPRAEVPLRIDIKGFGYRILIGKETIQVPKLGDGKYDTQKLSQEMKKIKALYPEKTDAVITVDDDRPYEDLITGMDTILDSGFPEVAVATTGVE